MQISNFLTFQVKNLRNVDSIELSLIDCNLTRKSLIMLMECYLTLGEYENASNIYLKIVEFKGIFESECDDEKKIFTLGYVANLLVHKKSQVLDVVYECLQMSNDMKIGLDNYVCRILSLILDKRRDCRINLHYSEDLSLIIEKIVGCFKLDQPPFEFLSSFFNYLWHMGHAKNCLKVLKGIFPAELQINEAIQFKKMLLKCSIKLEQFEVF